MAGGLCEDLFHYKSLNTEVFHNLTASARGLEITITNSFSSIQSSNLAGCKMQIRMHMF